MGAAYGRPCGQLRHRAAGHGKLYTVLSRDPFTTADAAAAGYSPPRIGILVATPVPGSHCGEVSTARLNDSRPAGGVLDPSTF